MLGLKAAFHPGLLDQKHIWIRLNHEDDFHRLWLRDQWFITYQQVSDESVQAVTDFQANAESSVAIWVSYLSARPFVFQKQYVLCYTTLRTIRKPFKFEDRYRYGYTYSNQFARICVKVNILKPLPKRI
ncbi:hypothetical protein Acr_25g0002490 [Actinidia rufa]|uniref:Uncharacterized protein n=1 Tax=Actinidia rufa TaxID=165716 RepID=A0A7J0GYC5_9ERIC|nr:hypothetical protein Acr_25g0002490 [Actinidia rufa]